MDEDNITRVDGTVGLRVNDSIKLSSLNIVTDIDIPFHIYNKSNSRYHFFKKIIYKG
jgi:hypothetical protein